MIQDSLKGRRLFGLFLLGALLFNYPLLSLFNLDRLLWGLPLLLVYLFSVWILLIVLMILASRGRPPHHTSLPSDARGPE